MFCDKIIIQLYDPIIDCCNDKDEKVRFLGFEAIIQLTDNLGKLILINFINIFSKLNNRISDTDDEVKQLAEIYDKNLRTIANISPLKINIQEFIKIITEQLQGSNPNI